MRFEDLKIGDRVLVTPNKGNEIWEDIVFEISSSKKYIKMNDKWLNIEDYDKHYTILEKLKSLPTKTEKMTTHIPKW